jgi:putative restriction endonuclease
MGERLDVYNGLLLAPNLDAAFDRGFATVADNGVVIVASVLPEPARRLLDIDSPLRVLGLHGGHRKYVLWHRERVFRAAIGVCP